MDKRFHVLPQRGTVGMHKNLALGHKGDGRECFVDWVTKDKGHTSFSPTAANKINMFLLCGMLYPRSLLGIS